MANWDNPFSHWDDGETYDAGQSGGNPGNVQPYLDLITSEHNKLPKFMAMVEGLLRPFADALAVAQSLRTIYDVDSCGGMQLDAVGVWVGRSRQLTIPITDVYFAFNTGPGFNKGIFKLPNSPLGNVILLPDDQYRTLLKATIAANHWDGTVTGAYEAYRIIFGPLGYAMIILDRQDMSMDEVLAGPVPDALTLQLFLQGYLSLKPAGVRVRNRIVSANSSAKIFAFNAPADSPSLGGFNTSAFPTFYPGV